MQTRSDGTYLAQYYVTQQGEYDLLVTINGTPLPTTYTIQVQPGQVRADQSTVQLTGLPTSKIVVAGATISVSVTARDASGNLVARAGVAFHLVVTYSDGSGVIVSAALALQGSVYVGECLLVQAGGAVLSVSYSGSDLGGYPVNIRVQV